MTDAVLSEHLAPADFVDSDSPEVRDFAERAAAGATAPAEVAARLFTAVRDGIWYDPFDISADPADYRASAIAAAPRAWCVPKAVLLTAAARARGIPARVGFADVRNHLTTPKLAARMGTDLFVFHGYADLYLGGRWVKATPAFNAELCARFGVAPIPFDGSADALMHEFSGDGSRYMEYVQDRGVFTDLPFDLLFRTFDETYGPGRMTGGDRGPADTFRHV